MNTILILCYEILFTSHDSKASSIWSNNARWALSVYQIGPGVLWYTGGVAVAVLRCILTSKLMSRWLVQSRYLFWPLSVRCKTRPQIFQCNPDSSFLKPRRIKLSWFISTHAFAGMDFDPDGTKWIKMTWYLCSLECGFSQALVPHDQNILQACLH